MAHVLVVEDDRDILEALVDLLEFEGHEVATAPNGAEGLAAARRHHPDVILLDLMMPVMNGWQFRDEQKRDGAIRDVPVVVLSAMSDPGLDVAGFIAKPCTIQEVLGAVIQHGTPPAGTPPGVLSRPAPAGRAAPCSSRS